MEVIDDCFVAFFGAIFGAILPITSHVLNSQKKKTDDLRKQKNLSFTHQKKMLIINQTNIR
jgi:hypothetical protein